MPGTLTYFGLGARGEPTRALCHLANFEFENKTVTPEEFGAMKPDLPLGSLPIWEEDGNTICQSNAILRMMGIRLGYYSTDPNTMWAIDSLLDFLEDNYESMLGRCSKQIFGQEPTAEDDEKFLAYYDKTVPLLTARLEKHGKKYIAGTDKLTIADIKVYQGFTVIFENPANLAPQELKDKALAKIAASPILKTYLDQLKQDMSGWLAVRPPTPI